MPVDDRGDELSIIYQRAKGIEIDVLQLDVLPNSLALWAHVNSTGLRTKKCDMSPWCLVWLQVEAFLGCYPHPTRDSKLTWKTMIECIRTWHQWDQARLLLSRMGSPWGVLQPTWSWGLTFFSMNQNGSKNRMHFFWELLQYINDWLVLKFVR